MLRDQAARFAPWRLLKEMRPSITRVPVIRDPASVAEIGMFGAIQAVAPSLGVQVSPVNLRDAGQVESAIAAFVRSSHEGLIVTGSPLALRHRDLIVSLAARHKLPAVYGAHYFVAAGGLFSYAALNALHDWNSVPILLEGKGRGLRDIIGVPLPCVTSVSTKSNLGLPGSVTS